MYFRYFSEISPYRKRRDPTFVYKHKFPLTEDVCAKLVDINRAALKKDS